ncbi:hypothetical protein ABZX90_33990 [Streptomyces sp. NPDC002935]|uniref:hypothetical protein n=1 Tax=Streptomyces sp. NPDC002935 TaxID=3154545 RepID=UPI0033B5D63D
MSNSAAAAVLTTAHLPDAIRAVRTLLGIADTGQAEVDFEAVIRSPEVLTQVQHVLPDLKWSAAAGKEHGSSEAGDNPAGCLPIQIFDWCRPLDRAEPFIAALGSDPAAVRWDLDAWPAVPEPGLEAISQKYAYLTLTVNSRDLYPERRPDRPRPLARRSSGRPVHRQGGVGTSVTLSRQNRTAVSICLCHLNGRTSPMPRRPPLSGPSAWCLLLRWVLLVPGTVASIMANVILSW